MDKQLIIEKIKTVIDPHIGIDVYTLGFIYDIEIRENNTVFILMTLSTPMCPLESELKQDITDAVLSIPDVKNVEIKLTFNPPWKPPAELLRKPEDDIMF
jgi:metal-sulfur cluster biosynthetic enzyme